MPYPVVLKESTCAFLISIFFKENDLCISKGKDLILKENDLCIFQGNDLVSQGDLCFSQGKWSSYFSRKRPLHFFKGTFPLISRGNNLYFTRKLFLYFSEEMILIFLKESIFFFKGNDLCISQGNDLCMSQEMIFVFLKENDPCVFKGNNLCVFSRKFFSYFLRKSFCISQGKTFSFLKETISYCICVGKLITKFLYFEDKELSLPLLNVFFHIM